LSVVRVLLACSLGGSGHLTPILAAGAALRGLGHDTVILVSPSLTGEIAGAGFDYIAGEDPPRAFVEDVWSRVRAGPAEEVMGLIDRELFADRCTNAMLATARRLRDRWRPELVIREPCEYASAIAAHEAGLPQAQVGISLAATEWSVLQMVEEILEGFRPGVTRAIATAPYLSPFPRSLDRSPWEKTRRFRHAVSSGGKLPAWWSVDGPLVYMTFGSVLGWLREAPEVYRAGLAAVSALPGRVLLTMGRAVQPAQFADAPENIHVAQWVPQEDVLPHASLVVCHGGSGTTLGALAAGVPLVICPLFADQADNGRIVEQAGAGVVVEPGEAAHGGLRRLGPDDVPALRAAITQVLEDPGYRQAAHRVATEIAATPEFGETVAQLLT
jgi:UDP:flavonoid glycosyltransferase YjiC (YdhE family)